MLELEDLPKMGYGSSRISNYYFTCRVGPDKGASIAKLSEQWFVQFFPWTEGPSIHRDDTMEVASGHEAYANFITSQASQASASGGKLFDKWPFLLCPLDVDILTIKCVIEDGLAEITRTNGGLNAKD
jgi:hypothetical protein